MLALDASRFGKTDLHIHVPAGAVPKDGPSAGVAIAAALISLFRDKPIKPNLAMTGEVTLTGRVLPVGGVREKILAARRAGIETVLLPRHNEKDLVDIPAEVKADSRSDWSIRSTMWLPGFSKRVPAYPKPTRDRSSEPSPRLPAAKLGAAARRIDRCSIPRSTAHDRVLPDRTPSVPALQSALLCIMLRSLAMRRLATSWSGP